MMMKSRKTGFLIFSAFLMFFTICQRVESPLLSDYNGYYSIEAQWISPQDTFPVLAPCTLMYITDKDTFASIDFQTEPGNRFDTSFLRETFNDSQMVVVFTAPFKGSVRLIGTRPNELKDTCTLPVIVKNQFRLSGETTAIAGSSVSVSISSVAGRALTVEWYAGNRFAARTEGKETLSLKCDTAGTLDVYAVVKDSLGNSINTDTMEILFLSRPPKASFPLKTLTVPAGQSFTFTVQKSDCDSLHWIIKQQNRKISTIDALTFTFTDPGIDTVILRGSNKYGMLSDPETLFVNISAFEYGLKPVAGKFPDTIMVGKWAKWEIEAVRGKKALKDTGISYFWNVIPDSIFDSIKTSISSNTLELFFNDSQPPFTILVSALVGTDSTYSIQKSVYIRKFRPYCTFITGDTTISMSRDLQLSVRAGDSNDSGLIKDVFYRISDDGSTYSTGGAKKWTVRFLTPGRKVIKAWAVDNDGFVSDTASIYVDVNADGPYFVRPLIDTTIYIKDTVKILVPAVDEDGSSPVAEYFWDFDNDGVWDRITELGMLNLAFSDTGVNQIRAGCRGENGDTARIPAEVKITVIPGSPQVKSVSFSPKTVYVGDPVTVRVKAADSNGVVKQVAIGIDGVMDNVFQVKANQSIDTSFNIEISEIGKFAIKAAVIDEDGQKSEYVFASDSINVSSGVPVVESVKPDTCWIYDDTTYHITAFDVNGDISGYYIQWEEGSFQYSEDSTFNHSFSTEGLKNVRVYVVDDEEQVSDTVTFSILVLSGKPSIKHSFPDSVWYMDTVQYELTGTDQNGLIKSFAISWEDGEPFEFKKSNLFSHSYLTPGMKEVKAFVLDDDSLSSDTLIHNVYVRLGLPSFKSIIMDRPDSEVYILDNIRFTVKGSDPNDFIDSIYLSTDGDTIFERKIKAISDSAVFPDIYFSKADSGSRELLFRIKDNDGLVKDTALTLTVKSGAPVIDSIVPGSVWIGDTNSFTIYYTDKNGSVDTFAIDWNNSGKWEGKGVNIFSHRYDTSEAGTQTVKVKVRDDDSLWTTKSFQITVRLGRPLIKAGPDNSTQQWKKGENFDTLNAVFKDIDLIYMVNGIDSNGTIVEYEWYRGEYDGTYNYKTDVPELKEFFTLNMASLVTVRGRDDDSLWSNLFSFYILPDSFPPAPEVIVPLSQPGMPDVKIQWRNLDRVDDSLTCFAVLAGSSKNSINDTIISFTQAKSPEFGKNGEWLNYQFDPQLKNYNGTFYCKVVARDHHGSTSEGNEVVISYPY
jgi:hypothetical protein